MLATLASLLLAIHPAAAETIRPDIGQPLRDASVCAGPDGNYYLTGAIATALPDGSKPSYDNCRGVQVWKSKDLKSWEDLGLVWDLWKDPKRESLRMGGSAWQAELLPVPGLPPGERARGMTAPRLAHDGQSFWITFSMNGYAAGAMPGGPEAKGPYADTLLCVEAGAAPTDKSDATLFVDVDGTRYLLWGGGCLARLKSPEDLQKMKEADTAVDGPVHYLPALAGGFGKDAGLPEYGAPYGPSLFYDGKRYQFIFTAATLRDGAIHEDSYACSSEKLLGPYSTPAPLVAASGRCTAFRGPGGVWQIAYSDAQGHPVIAPFAPGQPAPAKPGKKLGPARIATQVPPRKAASRPADVPQLIDWIEPCLDRPLRDAAICLGPDKTWYLIGTEAAEAENGGLDWSRNNGIHLWKSVDRKSWTDCGYVWDIDRDAAKSPKSAWQLESHLDITCGASPKIGRAMSAPEIHFLKGTFWIVYSMNGSGIGILKSTTGKADGPYEDLGGIVVGGRDPSLFEDGGKIYLVWGQGFFAELNADLSALAGPVRTSFTSVKWYPREMRRCELMGIWGSRLAKQDDWYIWAFTTRTGRLGINSIDTVASWSKSLDGPWSEPCLMLANGGQSTLVRDGNGGWLATVSGEDEYSHCPYQPAITPVVTGPGGRGAVKPGAKLALRAYDAAAHVSQWQAINSYLATELDLWIGYPDFIRTEARDVFVGLIDGYYYMTGTHWGSGGKYMQDVVLFRSKDLIHWEELPTVYNYAKLKEDGVISDIPKFDAMLEKAKARKPAIGVQVGECKLLKFEGKFYVLFANCGAWPGMPLIESAGADPTGPYKAIGTLPFGDITPDEDGAVFVITPKPQYQRFETAAAFLEFVRSGKKYEFAPIEYAGMPNVSAMEDCETGLERVHGKYVYWSTDWTGSYDCNYFYADSFKGPWKGELRILPHGGNGKLFEDKDGNFWYAHFMNSNEWATRAQNWCRPNMYPLDVVEEDGELILEPKALRANRARLDAMGALWQSRRPGAK